MKYLVGNYYLKMDAKNRVAIPAALKSKLPNEGKAPLVVTKGLGDFLVIYTQADWEKKLDGLMQLSEYSDEEQEFVRRFTYGAMEVEPDSALRLLLPKYLTDLVGIDQKGAQDVVFNCVMNRIEVWEQKTYEREMAAKYDMSSQAKKFMVKPPVLTVVGRDKDE